MDPFRDELSAAHAKIAQLEERIRELQEELRQKSVPPRQLDLTAQRQLDLTRRRSGGIPLWVIAIASSFVASGVVAGLYCSMTRTTAPLIPASFKGIATAEVPQTANGIPSIVNPGAVASASAKPASKPPCNCTPGDPLCTCL